MNHKNPFFILANPRSGSSLFRIICDCNSQLSVPPESGFLVWWKSKYESVTKLQLASPKFLDGFLDDILASKKIETWHLEKASLQSYILRNSPTNYSEVVSLIYYFQAEKRNKKPIYWGDKNNYYIQHLEALLNLYPDAKFIHLVRDGRDVACSYINLKTIESKSPYFPKLPDKTEAIAKEWVANTIQIDTFLKQRKPENTLQLHFEDVVMHTEEISKRVCLFLNVDYDDAMLQYFKINSDNAIEPSETLDWKRKTLQQPDQEKIGYFKTQLSEKEIDRFAKIASKTLRRFGYE